MWHQRAGQRPGGGGEEAILAQGVSEQIFREEGLELVDFKRGALVYGTPWQNHPAVFAVQRIAESAIDELVVTDSIPLRKDAQACKKIRVLSVAGLLAETILRISNEDSVSSLFVE